MSDQVLFGMYDAKNNLYFNCIEHVYVYLLYMTKALMRKYKACFANTTLYNSLLQLFGAQKYFIFEG